MLIASKMTKQIVEILLKFVVDNISHQSVCQHIANTTMIITQCHKTTTNGMYKI